MMNGVISLAIVLISVEDEEIINPKPLKKGNLEEEEWVDDSDEEETETRQLAERFSDLKFADMPVIYEPPEKNNKKNKKAKDNEPRAFIGTDKDLQEGEMLEYDNEAYDLFHRMTTDW